jgi:hypothetical protein
MGVFVFMGVWWTIGGGGGGFLGVFVGGCVVGDMDWGVCGCFFFSYFIFVFFFFR